jgi:hypothetical protein
MRVQRMSEADLVMSGVLLFYAAVAIVNFIRFRNYKGEGLL